MKINSPIKSIFLLMIFLLQSCVAADTNSTNRLQSTEQSHANWTFCSLENEICKFDGTRVIRYGIDPNWNYSTRTGPVICSNTEFGDSYPNKVKICEISRYPDNDILAKISNLTCSTNQFFPKCESTRLQRIQGYWIEYKGNNNEWARFKEIKVESLPGKIIFYAVDSRPVYIKIEQQTGSNDFLAYWAWADKNIENANWQIILGNFTPNNFNYSYPK